MNRNVHILGSVQNIKIARDAVVSLILGSPPGTFSPEQSQNYADVSRKGLRSFEICWSQAQAAILKHRLGYRFGVYVLIFGFSACSNDYLHDDVRSLGLYHFHGGGLYTDLCVYTSHQ
jgi:rRNA processing protein Krr1/Pno1